MYASHKFVCPVLSLLPPFPSLMPIAFLAICHAHAGRISFASSVPAECIHPGWLISLKEAEMGLGAINLPALVRLNSLYTLLFPDSIRCLLLIIRFASCLAVSVHGFSSSSSRSLREPPTSTLRRLHFHLLFSGYRSLSSLSMPEVFLESGTLARRLCHLRVPPCSIRELC